MDPAGIKLTDDDLIAGDFPVPHVFGIKRTSPGWVDDDETVEGDPDSADYLIGDFFVPKPSRPLHSTRCVATALRTGQRCRRWAVIGFTKCEKHSGYGRLANLKEYRERVLERARLDLLRTAPYAVETLAELVRDTDVNPAVRLKASTEVLDRVGVRGGVELDVTVRDEGASPADMIRARLDRLAASMALPAAPAPAPSASESEILDAEVLDDDAAV